MESFLTAKLYFFYPFFGDTYPKTIRLFYCNLFLIHFLCPCKTTQIHPSPAKTESAQSASKETLYMIVC